MATRSDIEDNIKKMRAMGATDIEVSRYVQIEASRRQRDTTWGGYLSGLADAFTGGALAEFGDELTAAESATLGRRPDGGTFDLFNYGDPSEGHAKALSDAYARGAAAEFGDQMDPHQVAEIRDRPVYGATDLSGAGRWAARYNQALEAERAQNRDFASRAPVSNFAGKLAGGLSTVIGVPALRAATAANTVRGSAGIGGAMGAVTGFGAGQGDLANRSLSGVVGAGIGAGVGAATPYVIRAATPVGRWAMDRLRSIAGGTKAQESMAARQIAQDIMDDNPGMTPAQAVAATERKLSEMGPSAAVMDTGENVRAGMAAISRPKGSARTRIHDFLDSRQLGTEGESGIFSGGQFDRLTKLIDDSLPDDYRPLKQTLSKPSDDASDLYKEAFRRNQSVESPTINRILNTPEGKEALKLAARDAANKMTLVGKPDKELAAVAAELRSLGLMDDPATGAGIARGLRLQTLDFIKRHLQQIWRAKRNSENPMARQEARNASGLSRMLIRELDDLDVTARVGPNSSKAEGGAYAQGRAMEMNRLRAQSALEDADKFLGAKFNRPDAVRDAIEGMSQAELHAFRASVAATLKQRIGDVRRANDASKKLFDFPNIEEKLGLVFGNGETLKKYLTALRGEKEMYRSFASVKGGSQTAEREAVQAQSVIDPNAALQIGVDIASQNPLAAATTAARAVRGGHRPIPPEPVRAAGAEILTGRDLGFVHGGARALSMSDARKRAIARALIMSGAMQGGNVAP